MKKYIIFFVAVLWLFIYLGTTNNESNKIKTVVKKNNVKTTERKVVEAAEPVKAKRDVLSKEEEVAKNYEKAVSAIDNWLNSIPEEQYKKATKDEVFNLKLNVLDVSMADNYNSFLALNKLLKEIGDKEFEYDIFKFNKKSIRCLQLYMYVGYLGENSNNNDETFDMTPQEFFKNQYSFYKKNITNKREQWEWLNGFLQVLSYNRFVFSASSNINKNYVKNFAQNNYDEVMDILKQYMAVGTFLLKRDPSSLGFTGWYYTNRRYPAYQDMDLDLFLVQLYAFVNAWADYLKKEDKEIILNFILPKYQENKYALKIYSILAK